MSALRAYSREELWGVARSASMNWQMMRALFNLIAAALLVRAGGMVNQIVISASFGTGATLDAYFVAAAWPLLLAQLLSSALEAAVIPVYSRLRVNAERESLSRLLSTLVNALALISLPLVLVLIVARQPLLFFSAPGLDPQRFHQAFVLAPLLYLVLPVSLIIGVLEGGLNAEGQFGWPAYAGMLVPLTTAMLTLLGGKTWGVPVLCIGGLAGTILQLLVVFIRLRRARLRYRLVLDVRNPDLREILTAVWPVLLGALILQSGPLVDQMFISMLPTGTISAFNYALKLLSVFIGILFVSVGRAALPYLARQAALGDASYQVFKSTLRMYAWGTVFSMALLSLALALLERPLVALVFQHGAFSAADTRAAVAIFSGFLPGLVPMALGFLLSRAFNALGETRVPLLMALVSVGTNALLDAVLVHFWQGFGIALATSATSLITCLLLLGCLYQRIGALRIWHVPVEGRAMLARLKRAGADLHSLPGLYWLKRGFFTNDLRRVLFSLGLLLITLSVSIVATARNALATLGVSVGLVFFFSFVRYPLMLLLAWASLDVGIGSSLFVFNGTHLDSLLIFSLCCLLPGLPWKAIFARAPAFLWLTLYLGWVLLGMGLSPLSPLAFLTLWLTMLASVGVGALTIALVTTRRRFIGLITVLLTTALLVAVLGLYDFVTRQHGEVDQQTAAFRITSLFTQATTFAFYLSPLIPLAFYRCVHARGMSRLFALCVVLCLVLALLLTFTRSALPGVLLGLVVMVLCLPSRWRRLGLLGGVLVLGSAALFAGWTGSWPFIARFFNPDIATLNGRLYIWQALLRNFQVTRWLGNGLHSSDQLLAYLHVGVAGKGIVGTAPHSLMLGTLYDHGVIGLFLLGMAFLSLGRSLWRRMCTSCGEQRVLAACALASLTSVLLQSIGSRDLWIQAVGASFWIIVCLPFAQYWYGGGSVPSQIQMGDSRSLRGSVPRENNSDCQINIGVEGEV